MNIRVWTVGTLLLVGVISASGSVGSDGADGSVTAGPIATAVPSANDSLVGIFEGRTPCGELFVEFAGYQGPACEKMKWWLALYRNPQSGAPSSYEFDGTRVTRRGSWTITRGTVAQPDAVVYRLATDLPQAWIAFQRVDDNVLLLLDQELRLMVGDASWSYTLSRTK